MRLPKNRNGKPFPINVLFYISQPHLDTSSTSKCNVSVKCHETYYSDSFIIIINGRLQQSSKTLAATSKFWAPEGRLEANPILRTHNSGVVCESPCHLMLSAWCMSAGNTFLYVMGRWELQELCLKYKVPP